MIRVFIGNMNCGGCAKGVAATLHEAVPDATVRVDLNRREVTVEGAADAAPVLAALSAAGWKAVPTAS